MKKQKEDISEESENEEDEIKKNKETGDNKGDDGKEANIIFDKNVMEARKKLIEFATANKKQIKAEKEAQFLFNHQSKNDELGKLLKEAKIEQITFDVIKREIESGGLLETVAGEIPKFEPHPEFLKINPVILFAGMRRTGKSYTVRDLLYKMARKTKFVMVLSSTAFSGYWQQYVPKEFVHENYKPEIIAKLLTRQKNLILKMKRKHPNMTIQEVREHPDNSMVLILDDIIEDKNKLRANKEIAQLAVAGRHYGITLFITTQYINSIGADFKGNSDLVFIFTQSQELQKEALYKNFMNSFSEEVAFKLMDEVAIEIRDTDEVSSVKYLESDMLVRSLVILNYLHTPNKMKTLAWYHAEEPPKFRLGAPIYWKKSGVAAYDNVYALNTNDPLMDTVLKFISN